MSWLVVMKCANCSLHAMVEGALSETVKPRLCSPVICEWVSGRPGDSGAVSTPTDLAVHSRSHRDQMTLPK